jgi:multidrug efflux pump subunit AcrB
MTAATTALSLGAPAVWPGGGAGLWSAAGLAVIGGALSATVLVPSVVSALYLVAVRGRARGRDLGRAMAEGG